MINGGNNLREDNDLREAIILNISHLKSNKLNIGLFNCSKFSSLINFQSFFIIDRFCWISMLFDLTGRGLKEEKMVRGAGGYYSRKLSSS